MNWFLIFLFFWVYAGLVTFHYQNFWFFWVYAGFVRFWHQNVDLFWVYAGSELFPIKCLVFLSICRFEGLEVHQTCIYSKKINMLMPKVHKTCIYSKKSKVLIVKSHQTCIYSKKSKKKQKPIHLCQSVPHRVWDFWFFDFFEYMQVWCLFTIKNFWFFWVYAGFVHFWHQHVDFFLMSICRFGEPQVFQTYIFATKKQNAE